VFQTLIPAEADFTDLAELISRIDEPRMRLGSPEFYMSEGGEWGDSMVIEPTSD
jgi:hypothetical protein